MTEPTAAEAKHERAVADEVLATESHDPTTTRRWVATVAVVAFIAVAIFVATTLLRGVPESRDRIDENRDRIDQLCKAENRDKQRLGWVIEIFTMGDVDGDGILGDPSNPKSSPATDSDFDLSLIEDPGLRALVARSQKQSEVSRDQAKDLVKPRRCPG